MNDRRIVSEFETKASRAIACQRDPGPYAFIMEISPSTIPHRHFARYAKAKEAPVRSQRFPSMSTIHAVVILGRRAGLGTEGYDTSNGARAAWVP